MVRVIDTLIAHKFAVKFIKLYSTDFISSVLKMHNQVILDAESVLYERSRKSHPHSALASLCKHYS